MKKTAIPTSKVANGVFPTYPKGREVDLIVARLRVYWVREPGTGPGLWNEGWRWRCGILASDQMFSSMEEAMWDASPKVKDAIFRAGETVKEWSVRRGK